MIIIVFKIIAFSSYAWGISPVFGQDNVPVIAQELKGYAEAFTTQIPASGTDKASRLMKDLEKSLKHYPSNLKEKIKALFQSKIDSPKVDTLHSNLMEDLEMEIARVFSLKDLFDLLGIKVKSKSKLDKTIEKFQDQYFKVDTFEDLERYFQNLTELYQTFYDRWLVTRDKNIEIPELYPVYEVLKENIKGYEKAFKTKKFKKFLISEKKNFLLNEEMAHKLNLPVSVDDIYLVIERILIYCNRFYDLKKSKSPFFTYLDLHEMDQIWRILLSITMLGMDEGRDIFFTGLFPLKEAIIKDLEKGIFFIPSIKPLNHLALLNTLCLEKLSLFNLTEGNIPFDEQYLNALDDKKHDWDHFHDLETSTDDRIGTNIRLMKRFGLEKERKQGFIHFQNFLVQFFSSEERDLLLRVLFNLHHEFQYPYLPLDKVFIFQLMKNMKASLKERTFLSQNGISVKKAKKFLRQFPLDRIDQLNREWHSFF